MKKIFLASIIAVSFLTLGTAYCKEKKEPGQKYIECLEQYKDLVPGKDYAKGSILLGFDKGVTKQEADWFIEKHDVYNELEMVDYNKAINSAVVKVPGGKEIGYVCYFNGMGNSTIVDYAEPNFIRRIQIQR